MKNKIFENYLWQFFERFGAQGVTFLVSVVLARMLDPTVYGIIAIVNVFLVFSNIFVDCGLSSALIQKADADDLDFSSAVYFNIVISIGIYLILFFAAPFIADFFDMPDLKAVIRVLGSVIIIAAVKSVQVAYISKKMMFKKFFFATLVGTVGAGVLGIVMAYRGCGVWSLVAQSIFNNAVDMVLLWLTISWRPKRQFSIRRIRGLFAYGWKILAASFLDTSYYQIRQLAIGKVYTADQLAYFNKGQNYPGTVLQIINTSMANVIFPAMSLENSDISRVRTIARKTILMSSFFLMPALIGLAACADKVVLLLLKEKWMPIVPYLRIYCVTYVFCPILTANIAAYKAVGKSDMILKLGIINDAICFSVIAIVLRKGIPVIAWSMLFTMLASVVTDTWMSRKYFDYSLFEQLRDILPTIAAATFMGISVFLIGKLPIGIFPALFLQILSGVAIYYLESKLLRNVALNETLHILKGYLKKSIAPSEENSQ